MTVQLSYSKSYLRAHAGAVPFHLLTSSSRRAHFHSHIGPSRHHRSVTLFASAGQGRAFRRLLGITAGGRDAGSPRPSIAAAAASLQAAPQPL